MRNNTIKITTGALMIAIFSILLLINRNTGGILEEIFLYVLPIPMVAYSARFGVKSSLPVVAAMGLMSIFLGTPLTIFYAVTEALIGTVMGGGIYHKADMSKTLFAVMILSAVCNVLNTIAFASLFGYDLQAAMNSAKNSMESGYSLVEDFVKGNHKYDSFLTQMRDAMNMLLTPEALFRILVFTMIVVGLIQGYLVYRISFLILNRLKFQMPQPKPITSFYPPHWTGVLVSVIFIIYTSVYDQTTDANLKQIAYTVGICAFLYMVFWGYIATLLLVRAYVSGSTIHGVIIATLFLLILSQGMMILGLVYIMTDFHKRWDAAAEASDARRAEKAEVFRAEYQRRMDEYKRSNPRGRK